MTFARIAACFHAAKKERESAWRSPQNAVLNESAAQGVPDGSSDIQAAPALIPSPGERARRALWRWIESVLETEEPPFANASDEQREAALVFFASEAYEAAARIEAGRDPHPGLDEILPSGR
jgi:hypothetical protein